MSEAYAAAQPWLLAALLALIKFAVVILGFVLPMASLLTWMERRQSAYTQDRLGPCRASFLRFRGRPVTAFGLVHVAADALKMLFKEPFTPRAADGALFRIAPLLGFLSPVAVMALIPFGPDLVTGLGGAAAVVPLQIARLDAGLLMVFALASLGVYGAALAGWSSNNRFALLGGLRASAQTISYEIALGLTVVGVLMAYGSCELSTLVARQNEAPLWGWLPRWGIVLQPAAAILFLTAAIAETKRAPFDLPEGESEILGYFVEYSSMGFGMFMLGEFIEVVVLGALFTTLFLGGWHLPGVLTAEGLNLGFARLSLGSVPMALCGMLVFAAKVLSMCILQLQIRWTLPRFRYDQLMHLGWKILLPLALANIAATACLIYIDPSCLTLAAVGLVATAALLAVTCAGPQRRATPATGHSS